jgi:hypothetical protein
MRRFSSSGTVSIAPLGNGEDVSGRYYSFRASTGTKTSWSDTPGVWLSYWVDGVLLSFVVIQPFSFVTGGPGSVRVESHGGDVPLYLVTVRLGECHLRHGEDVVGEQLAAKGLPHHVTLREAIFGDRGYRRSFSIVWAPPEKVT